MKTENPRKVVGPDTSEHDPSSTRVRPDQLKQPKEGHDVPVDSEPANMAHMGATEDDGIREKPPTDVLTDLLNSPGRNKSKADKQSPNDELTPG